MSSYGCTMFPGLHSFNHDAFMLWAAKSYRLACARESGVGAGPIELNMGEGWMSLETISNTSFQMRVRRHTTNGEIAFKLLYKDTHEWKGLVQGKLENNPVVSMILKRLTIVVSAYMLRFPNKSETQPDEGLLGPEDGEMDMRPDMACAVEDILMMHRVNSDAIRLVDFMEMLIEMQYEA